MPLSLTVVPPPRKDIVLLKPVLESVPLADLDFPAVIGELNHFRVLAP